MRSFSSTRGSRLTLSLLLVLQLCSCVSATKQNKANACRNNLGSAINNFCVVTPTVLWRGSRPDEDGVAWLIQHGVQTIVNLELIFDDKPVLGQAIIANTNNYEVGYFHIHDWEPLPILAPSIEDDHVAHFIAIVKQQPKPLYLHCRHGVNRTGVMVAAYRILIDGASDEEAIGEMARYDGFFFTADAQYIRGLTPKRRAEIQLKVMEWMPKLEKDAQVICAEGRCTVSHF